MFAALAPVFFVGAAPAPAPVFSQAAPVPAPKVQKHATNLAPAPQPSLEVCLGGGEFILSSPVFTTNLSHAVYILCI